MAIRLNHTILTAHDRDATVAFLTDILGLEPSRHYGPFRVLQLSNDISLDVLGSEHAIKGAGLGADGTVTPQHYAFLVDDHEFDSIFARVQDRELPYWGDPFHRHAGVTNGWYGGRGVYFDDPNGHSIEVMTAPYEMD
ncbi:VOC family protein [Streptomyces sp. NPDC058289]|uniref:VOC family protein n=1 Tax=Streptomyces sp. NPDC058289 TaxID=3346425 RepID=UPI0036E4125E